MLAKVLLILYSIVENTDSPLTGFVTCNMELTRKE